MNLAKNIASTVLATSLVAAPIAAQAAAPVRASSDVSGESLRGGFIIPLIALVAIILGILAATGGGKDRPKSP